MPRFRIRVAILVLGAMCGLILKSTAAAQSNGLLADGTLGGLTPPAPPAIVARDNEGHVIVRATRVAEAIVLDGRLDDPVYARVPSIGDFVQQEPTEGEPATEKTDVWLFFDDRNIYVAARCWDSHPERAVANEMRRDGPAWNDNENFGVVFDTFYDRRNAFFFAVTLAGSLNDSYITDERDQNRDWNTIWDAKTARFVDGWSAELVIPLKSLRFTTGQAPVWGVNFRRLVSWKINRVRKFTWDATYDHITDVAGRLESRGAQAGFRTELQDGDSMAIEYSRLYEFLAKPFAIVNDVTLPVGGYSYSEVRLAYSLGPQRRLSGIVRLERGSFYNGTRTGMRVNRGRLELTPQLSLEPGLTVNWIDLPAGQFTDTLISTRTTYTVTPRISASALVQYISDRNTLGTNVGLRWEYTPGSDFFIVLTDNRDTLPSGFPALQNRSVVVKLTRLFRM